MRRIFLGASAIFHHLGEGGCEEPILKNFNMESYKTSEDLGKGHGPLAPTLRRLLMVGTLGTTLATHRRTGHHERKERVLFRKQTLIVSIPANSNQTGIVVIHLNSKCGTLFCGAADRAKPASDAAVHESSYLGF